MTRSNGVAVVGIGCRLPGGIGSPKQFASFLRAHGDAVVDVPGDRWNADLHYDADPQAAGKAYVRRAAFLQQDVFSFDPEPFGISSKEADQLDPQQRLLLEVSWEAFEDAGIPIDRLRGSQTAVFIGGFTLDHQAIAYLPQNRRLISAHTSVGASMTLLSNRISYTFDLRGPSLTVDTACSSSLVATHMGFESIARGECDLAIVGGVNVILSPTVMVAMCKGQFLAPDGRSKTFDARADGYGRGEGAAVVVLKALDRALADGDRIYSVILATGLNQDGRTPGIAMPSEHAQRSLCARVLRESGLSARDIGYVEAHGTGTRAGDPIEARALAAVYGCDREGPLVIGSVKPNIGHLEAASGVAGLLKATLSVHHREIFPLRAVGTLNPDIPFGDLNLEVAVESRTWPVAALARVAVNSFGYGGTNAHAIVSEGPAPALAPTLPRHNDARTRATRDICVVPFSAASPEALLAHAEQLSEAIDDGEWRNQAYTLARRRAHLPARAAVLASSAAELREQLQKAAQGDWSEDRIVGRAPSERRLLWVFTGMGPQWWAMGHDLCLCEPVFQKAAQEADAEFQGIAGWSVLAEMLKDEQSSRMRSNAVAQPANFVLQVGLVALLRDLGVPEDGLLGHSVGEVTAAWAAGCLSLRDAAFVACHRSRLQQKMAGQGTMLAVALSEEQVQRFLGDERNVRDVEVAALNAPRSLTLSGSRHGLEAISARLTGQNVFNRFVPVEVAYHSSHMDPLEAEFFSILGSIEPRAPERILFSTARGTRLSGPDHDASYWWENARRPVLLQRALERALADGYTAFLEVGPHPVLGSAIREVVEAQGGEARTSFCLKRGQPEAQSIQRAMASLFTNGVLLDWERLHPQGHLSDLPKYPFRRELHWTESKASREIRMGRTDGPFSEREDGPVLRLVYDLARPNAKYLLDHRIQGAAVFPGAGYIDCALQACVEAYGSRSEYVVEGMRFLRTLVVRPNEAPVVRVDVDKETGAVDVYARHEDQAWERYARGRLLDGAAFDALPAVDIDRMRADLTDEVDVEETYRSFDRLGLSYGAAFRGLRALRTRRDGAGTTFLLARIGSDSMSEAGTCVHPVVVDAAFQALLGGASVLRAMVPVSAVRIRWFKGTGPAVWAEGTTHAPTEGRLRADLVLRDESGAAVLEIRGLDCRVLEGQEATGAALNADLFHLDAWRPAPWPQPSQEGVEWGLVGTAERFFERLGDTLDRRGISSRRIEDLDAESIDDCSALVFASAPDENDPVGLAACERLRRLVQRSGASLRALRVVTFSACGITDEDTPNPAQAALWGFSRVIMTEYPKVGCRLVDLVATEPSLPLEVVDLLTQPAVDEEAAVRGNRLYVHRIRRASTEEMVSPRQVVLARDYDGAFGIERSTPSKGVRFSPRPSPTLQPGEIEVAVLCASLDTCDDHQGPFGSPDAKAALRMGPRSVVGTVTRRGSNAMQWRVGDRVHVLQKSELTSHVVVKEERAVSVAVRHATADAIGYADFFLAWHVLFDVARLEKGDRVLIHHADAALGSACVQVASLLGAVLFVTVGEKGPDEMRPTGVDAIYSAHTLEFVDGIMARTAQKGVHLVLNTLRDPARTKSVEVLGASGRFIELNPALSDHGRDVDLRRLRFGQSYDVVDLEHVAEERPKVYRELSERVLAAFASGQLTLPRTRVVSAGDAMGTPEGRYVDEGANARVALDFTPGDGRVDLAAASLVIRRDRSYLVTGGLSGFGLLTAEWLVEQGAGNVVLGSRRGEVGAEAAPAMARMRHLGARVECTKLDVTNGGSVESVLDFTRSMAPLGGVFHSAMVLDDRPIATLGPDSLRNVMRPKALGAWLLYKATRGDQLDQFVLYSSVSALIGNPNQAAYAAANAYLDALAMVCRRERRAGTSISWGAIDDVGIVARSTATRAHLQRLGLEPLPARMALQAMDRVLRSEHANVAIIDARWGQWVRNFPQTAWRRLAELRLEDDDRSGHLALQTLRSEMSALEPTAGKKHIVSIIKAAACHVLGTHPDRLDAEVPLTNYGLDSLIAVELQTAIERVSGVAIPTIHFLAGVSATELSERLIENLAVAKESAVQAVSPAPAPAENLRDYFLSRICVQPPYFDLFDCVRDGNWIEASVRPAAPSDEEADVVSCAEAARHLAILGSCAVSERSPFPGRVYYPVRRAYSTLSREDVDPQEVFADSNLDTVRVRARCLSFDAAASQATAECELLDPGGSVLFRLMVDYHIIPADDFGRLFAAHHERTREDSGLDPYVSWRSPVIRETKEGVQVMSLGPVEPEWCLGHFVGYPALPVSIMTRHAIQLIAHGTCSRSNPRAQVAFTKGWVETRSFLFAHQTATARAWRLEKATEQPGQVWRCEIRREADLIASFEFNIEVVMPRGSGVHELAHVDVTHGGPRRGAMSASDEPSGPTAIRFADQRHIAK